MFLLVALLGVLGTLSLVFCRVNFLAQGVGPVIDTAGTVTSAWRRHKFHAGASKSPLDMETDTRAASAALAVAIAKDHGPLTADVEDRLCREFQDVFETTKGEELLVYARWLIKDSADPYAVSRRVSRLLSTQLWHQQKEQLIDMLARISHGDPDQVRAIGHAKARLGV